MAPSATARVDCVVPIMSGIIALLIGFRITEKKLHDIDTATETLGLCLTGSASGIHRKLRIKYSAFQGQEPGPKGDGL